MPFLGKIEIFTPSAPVALLYGDHFVNRNYIIVFYCFNEILNSFPGIFYGLG